jgi:hypothetical protein
MTDCELLDPLDWLPVVWDEVLELVCDTDDTDVVDRDDDDELDSDWLDWLLGVWLDNDVVV